MSRPTVFTTESPSYGCHLTLASVPMISNSCDQVFEFQWKLAITWAPPGMVMTMADESSTA